MNHLQITSNTFAWLKSWLIPPRYKNDAAWQDDDLWYREILKPDEEKRYDYLVDYARQKYELMFEAFSELDSKAESLFKFSATMSAVIFAVVTTMKIEMSGWMISAFLAFLMSMIVTIRIRMPMDAATPVSVRKAIDSVPQSQERYMHALLAASYHMAFSGTNVANAWKARQLSRASLLFFVGLVLLFSGLLDSPATSSGLPNNRAESSQSTQSESEEAEDVEPSSADPSD